MPASSWQLQTSVMLRPAAAGLLQSMVTSATALNSKTGAHAECAYARETTYPPITLNGLRSGSGQADGSLYWANQTMQMVQIECQQY